MELIEFFFPLFFKNKSMPRNLRTKVYGIFVGRVYFPERGRPVSDIFISEEKRYLLIVYPHC